MGARGALQSSQWVDDRASVWNLDSCVAWWLDFYGWGKATCSCLLTKILLSAWLSNKSSAVRARVKKLSPSPCIFGYLAQCLTYSRYRNELFLCTVALYNTSLRQDRWGMDYDEKHWVGCKLNNFSRYFSLSSQPFFPKHVVVEVTWALESNTFGSESSCASW